MEDGDLGTWEASSITVVLEGVLCRPRVEGRLLRRHLSDNDQWEWQMTAISCVQRYAQQSTPIDVITFQGEEVAAAAAEWFQRYDVDVQSTEAVEIDPYCRSLAWRHNKIQAVVDSDPDRLARFGWRGYATVFGGTF
jgi:hypothetical protein